MRLTAEQKQTLLQLIERWAERDFPGGLEALPDGVYALRNALYDDWNDTQPRRP